MVKRKQVASPKTVDSEQSLATPSKKLKTGNAKEKPPTKKTSAKTTTLTVRLADLTQKDQKAVLEEAKRQLIAKAQLQDCELLNIKYEKEIYEVEYFVKYLHPASWFAVKNAGPKGGYTNTEPPELSVKPGTNTALTKKIISLATDSIRSKEWIKINTTKITSGKPVFLVISDGTSKETINYVNKISIDLPNSKYQIKDNFGSLINEKHVMFDVNYATKKDRQQVTDNMTK